MHRLIHQGIDATEQGDLTSAQALFAQTLQLARAHVLPQWEAQSLFGHAVTLDRAAQYTEVELTQFWGRLKQKLESMKIHQK